MKPLARSTLRIAPRPLAVCLAAALGLNASPMHGAPTREPMRAPAVSTGAPDLHNGAARGGRPHMPNGTFVVTNCNDAGAGSFRDAAANATSDSEIDLTALPCSTITLTSGAVNLLLDYIYLTGPGSDRLTIVGNGTDRVIGHAGYGELYISGMTLTNGAVPNSAGGCLYSSTDVALNDVVITACRTYSTGTYTVLGGGAYARGNLTVLNSTISGNLVTAPSGSAYGGGLFAHGDLRVVSSTISGNTASGLVGNTGGIATTADVDISYSTISGNQAQFNAGLGLFSQYATSLLSMRSTTVSGNTATIEDGGIGTGRDIELYNCTITDNHDNGGPAATGGLFLGTGVKAYLYSSIIAGNDTAGNAADITGYAGSSVDGSGNLVIASTLALPFATRCTPIRCSVRSPTTAVLPGHTRCRAAVPRSAPATTSAIANTTSAVSASHASSAADPTSVHSRSSRAARRAPCRTATTRTRAACATRSRTSSAATSSIWPGSPAA